MLKWFGLLLAGLTVVAGVGVRWYSTTRPDYRLRAGREALRQGDWSTANELAALLENSGNSDHACLLRGDAHYRQGAWDRALSEFNRIEDQGPLRLQAAGLSGCCLMQLKQLAAAAEAFRFVLSEAPDDLVAHRGLAAILYDQGALFAAADHLEAVARLDPRDGRPLRLLGLIFKDLEQFGDAITAYDRALERELADAAVLEVRVELATCLVRRGEFARALERLGEQALPGTLTAQGEALRGEALWGLERADEARAVLDRALANYGDVPVLLRQRARIHLAEEQVSQAVGLLRQILEVERHDYASRYQLAQALEQLGRKDEAAEQRRLAQQTQELLTEMTKLNQQILSEPWNAVVQARLAVVCEQLDRHDLARMWRQAASASPAAMKP